jgi:RHS repeat-associated protein
VTFVDFKPLRRISKTAQSGRVTTFCYDNANRLICTIDSAQKTTAYEYNARSQLTAVADAINQRYEFIYDALGRVTQNKRGTATMSFVYDAAGNRSQRTDYNGVLTNYSYDALNRLTTISYPDTTSATYGYDVLSRLTTATNQNGTVTIGYDNRSRVNSVTDVFGQIVSYSYDANSNRTQLNLNGALNASYQYDVINRLTQLTDNASLNTTFAYDVINKLTSRTLPNGVVSTYQYDNLNRLTRLTHAKGANTLLDLQYQFNDVNNITQMIDNAGTHNYSYDPIDRLTAATHPNQPNESYTYDDVGNRVASHQGSSYTYQAFNRLVSANGTTFGYDTNGNQISKTEANGSWTYTWDYENRLKQASLAVGVTVNYSYDALDRCIQRTSSSSGTARFVYDGADVLRDLDSSGSAVADYLNALGIDNKLRQTVSNTTSYFLTDHLGTTRSLADSTGNISSVLAYDSFGNAISGSPVTRYTYTGREIDSDSSLMYYRARWYDAETGRFISEDPIGFLGGINLYGYVGNNPISYSDPFGLDRRGGGGGGRGGGGDGGDSGRPGEGADPIGLRKFVNKGKGNLQNVVEGAALEGLGPALGAITRSLGEVLGSATSREFQRFLESLQGAAAREGAATRTIDETRQIYNEAIKRGWVPAARGVESGWMGGDHINMLGPSGQTIHFPVPKGFVP